MRVPTFTGSPIRKGGTVQGQGSPGAILFILPTSQQLVSDGVWMAHRTLSETSSVGLSGQGTQCQPRNWESSCLCDPGPQSPNLYTGDIELSEVLHVGET